MQPVAGVRRKIDDLGRVVIPASMRKVLGIGVGDELDVRVEGETLVLSRPSTACAFCGSDLHLEQVHGKLVCWSCLAALRRTAAAVPDGDEGEAPAPG